jgi:hypothetical protein
MVCAPCAHGVWSAVHSVQHVRSVSDTFAGSVGAALNGEILQAVATTIDAQDQTGLSFLHAAIMHPVRVHASVVVVCWRVCLWGGVVGERAWVIGMMLQS